MPQWRPSAYCPRSRGVDLDRVRNGEAAFYFALLNWVMSRKGREPPVNAGMYS